MKLEVSILGGHAHFLRDVGRDVMEVPFDQHRRLIRHQDLRARLRALARDLGLGTKSESAFQRDFARLKLRALIMGPGAVQGWTVRHCEFDERISQWIVWAESPAVDIFGFEERLLTTSIKPG